jgi:hypothetical protein
MGGPVGLPRLLSSTGFFVTYQWLLEWLLKIRITRQIMKTLFSESNFGMGDKKERNLALKDLRRTLDERILDVWVKNQTQLMRFNNSQLVEAIWGLCKNGALSDEQLQVYRQLNILVNNIINAFAEENIHKDKVIFVEYIVRNLISMKFFYLRDVTLLKIDSININVKTKALQAGLKYARVN